MCANIHKIGIKGSAQHDVYIEETTLREIHFCNDKGVSNTYKFPIDVSEFLLPVVQ